MKWIKVFKTGNHTDSKGRKRAWTESDLDKAANAYNPTTGHEAPIVIGHPKENAPAYGWIEQLKRDGQYLLAKPKQVIKVFKEMVNSGQFKKKSVSFNSDGTFRHLGFLGAVPPAIKGLPDYLFSQCDDGVFEFAEELDDTFEFSEELDENIFKESDETDVGKTEFQERGNMPTLEELQKQLDSEKAEREKLENVNKELKNHSETDKKEFLEFKESTREKEINSFIDNQITAGKFLPAWKKLGISEFLQSLDEGETYNFSQGDDKVSQSKFMFNFLESLSEHQLFKEMVAPEGDSKEARDFAEDEKLAYDIAGIENSEK